MNEQSNINKFIRIVLHMLHIENRIYRSTQTERKSNSRYLIAAAAALAIETSVVENTTSTLSPYTFGPNHFLRAIEQYTREEL